MQEFVFGPVPSRRLGFSLCVDIIPRKYCSFDCIYCQVGKTTQKEVERRSFSDPGLIVKQVVERVEEGRHIDFISLSGSGEPTLSADIGEIIRAIKRKTPIPLAVITNGSLLFREDVRRDIAAADVVLPSLDATGDAIFERINRPHPALSFTQLVEGLRAFRRGYKGKIWLEIMLIKGINNGVEQLAIFKQIVSGLSADKVQLNTIARPPLEEAAHGLDDAELLSLAHALGNGCEIIPAFEGRSRAQKAEQWRESVLATLKRRSLSLDDIVRTTGVSPTEARAGLDRLVEEGKIRLVRFNDEWFYVAGGEENPS
jgi:wyosine [tRNA(Phe)-imidazoG37] synthetase (radical SAM superfamily)